MIGSVVRYDLGSIAGHPLGFTDACAARGRVFDLASAEAAVDAIGDGRVLGSQLGVITPHGVRAAPLCSAEGLALKAEGLAFDPARAGHAWIVLDPDAPEQPATLLEVELTGSW